MNLILTKFISDIKHFFPSFVCSFVHVEILMKPFHLVEDEARQELEGTLHKILEISSFQFKMSMVFCLPRNFQFSQNNLAKAFTKLAKNIIFLSKKYICNDQSKLKIAMFQLLMFSFSYRYENDKDLVQILDFLVIFFCIDLIYVFHKALQEIKKDQKITLVEGQIKL